MIFEMRTYRTRPGRREEFLDIFREKTMPEHARLGMPILGPFSSVEDPDTFFFIRGFESLESRQRLKDEFYDGSLWKDELQAKLMGMLEQSDSVLVDDPDGEISYPLGAVSPRSAG